MVYPAESPTAEDYDDDACSPSSEADPNRRMYPHAYHPEALLPRARQLTTTFDGGGSLADDTAMASELLALRHEVHLLRTEVRLVRLISGLI